jgi:hypothetical protein
MKTVSAFQLHPFSSWVQYIEQSQTHIVPGNWLEYSKGKQIPETDIAGFLVVRPISFLAEFPIGSSVAFWHSLVPVSAADLHRAKNTDVFQVAQTVDHSRRV